MATEIGIIKTLIGTAVATATDGSQRTLQVGDRVYQDEVISTGAAGAVEVEFTDGSVMTLGRSSQAILDLEVFNPSDVAQGPEDVDSDVEALQQALLDGVDPSQVADATAAGAGTPSGNEGAEFVQVIYEAPEVTPENGFDTTGINFEFDETQEEDEGFDDVPTASTTTVLLDEDDLVSEQEVNEAFEALRSDFEAATGFSAFAANAQGVGDEADGDDLPPGALTVVSGTLAADFGANGAGDITFNTAATQPSGLTSGGGDIQYFTSEDGHSLIGYTLSEGDDASVAEIIFTAQITDATTGAFTVALYGPLDHADGATEDNLTIDFGFTVQDSDDDTAQGILRFDIDDDAPVIGTSEEGIADEEGLATVVTQDDGYDGDAVGSNVTVNGNLNINWGADDNNAGDANRSVVFDEQVAPEGLTSHGVVVEYSINEDGTVITATAGETTVFTVSLSDLESGSYDFVLLNNLDHPTADTEDNINLTFTFTAIDSDGDTVSSSFSVSVDDDAPVTGETIARVDEDDLGEDFSPQREPLSDSLEVPLELEEFFTDISLIGGAPWNYYQGNDDESAGDDLAPQPRAMDEGTLTVNFGADGPGNIAFNEGGQTEGLTSQGDDIQYWVSEDGLSLVAYTLREFEYEGKGEPLLIQIQDQDSSEGEGAPANTYVEVVFTAEILDGSTGDYRVTLYSPVDHPDTSTEDNVQIDLGYTVTDFDGDSAQGTLTVDVDDDSPVIGYQGKGGQEPDFEQLFFKGKGGQQLRADEDDLPQGNDDHEYGDDYPSTSLHLPISFGADGPAENDPIKLSADSVLVVDSNGDSIALTSNGEPVTWEWVSAGESDFHYGQLIGSADGSSVVTITVQNVYSNGAFVNINLSGNLDHPLNTYGEDKGQDSAYEDNLIFDIAYTATDFDGDSVEGSFTVNIDDDMPVIGETLSENEGYSILLGARDGSADLDDWGVTQGGLVGTVTKDGVTANISFQDNDSNQNSQLRIYNNNANHIGTGSLADNDGQGINKGETLTITFDKLMQQAEIGVDGLGNHFLPESSQQAHATWVAYKNGEPVGSGEVDNPEGQNEGPEGLLEVITVTIPGGFDTIVFGNNSSNSGSNYEVRYIQAQTLNIVDEEGLVFPTNGNLGDSYSDGGDVAGAALTTGADLNISWGADDHNDNGGQADRSVTFDASQPGLSGLMSNGVAVIFELNNDSNVLTAKAGEVKVFTVVLSDLESGSFHFRLLANLDHDSEGGSNTEDDIDLTFNFIATDSDGDSAPGSFTVTVDDDGPLVDVTKNGQGKVVTDETDDLGVAVSGTESVFTTTIDAAISAGADGEQSRDVALNIKDSDSGLTTTTGYAITLVEGGDNNTVLGQYTVGDDTFDAFTVTISDAGILTVTQHVALEHPKTSKHNEGINLNGKLSAVVSVIDGDGDTASDSINLNGMITFKDDGPSVGSNAKVKLDDDAKEGGNDGGPRDNIDAQNVTGTLSHNYGADGEGTVLLSGTGAPAGFTYSLSPDATVLTISQGVTEVLRVSLDGETSGDYTVEQIAAIKHADDAANKENNIEFRVNYQVTDGDGDTKNGKIKINVDDDTPVVENDEDSTNEDTVITLDVLGNDNLGADGGSITDFSQPTNGTVVLNEDGTFTYTPAINFSGEDSFSYTVTDGDGDTAIANAVVNVIAVADAPNLIISVGNETALTSEENLVVNGSFEDIAGHDQRGREVEDTDIPVGGLVNRLDITGWDLVDGVPMEPHHKDHAGVGSTDGDNYMDLGATPGNSSIAQEFEGLIEGADYKLSFDYLDKAFKQENSSETPNPSVGQSGTDEGGKASGVMQVLWNGVVVATVDQDNRDTWLTETIMLTAVAGTNTLTFAEVGVDDDNWGLALDNVQMFHVPYQYDVTVSSSLTDVDGSESLGLVDIDVSLLPEGVTFDGTTLTSDTPLTDEQLNLITGSVTATETSNSDDATTTTNAKVEFDGVDATGETADLLLEGTSGADTIIGGSGDDIIFGGAGSDTLTGGAGADMFVWNKADADSSHDTVVDFNAAEDVLNLSDLLSDGSHTIEGIEVGAPGSEHLQLNIKDGADNTVQEIELSGVLTAGDAAATLQSLLDTGAINDGI